MASNTLVSFDSATMKAGWTEGEGNVVIGNPKQAVVLHVAWRRPDGTIAYDQIIRGERGGGATLLLDGHGNVGLITVTRCAAKDQASYAASWPEINVDELGLDLLESPRGLPKGTDLDASHTALREAAEESGAGEGAIQEIIDLGWTIDNTTYHPHRTRIMAVIVDRERMLQPTPDPDEGILKNVEWFSYEDVDRMIQDGVLIDGYTQAMLGAYFLRTIELAHRKARDTAGFARLIDEMQL